MKQSAFDELYDCLFSGLESLDFRILNTSNLGKIILRHDVDSSIEAANIFALMLSKKGIKSNFFFRMNSNLYNLFSNRNKRILGSISEHHEIGLHIESPSSFGNKNHYIEYFHESKNNLEKILDKSVSLLSWHRPIKKDLGGSDFFEGMLNLYSQRFFGDYRYLSDSAATWSSEKSRDSLNCILEEKPIQILLHPEWWISGTPESSFKISVLEQMEQQITEINVENTYFKNTLNLKNLFYDNI